MVPKFIRFANKGKAFASHQQASQLCHADCIVVENLLKDLIRQRNQRHVGISLGRFLL